MIFISFPLKLVLKFSGKLPTIFGAIVSFGPPVIVPLFAQLVKNEATINRTVIYFNFVISNKVKKLQNNNYNWCKHTTFSYFYESVYAIVTILIFAFGIFNNAFAHASNVAPEVITSSTNKKCLS